MPRVILIDDHPLFLAGLRSALAKDHSITVEAEAGDCSAGRDAVERVKPEVVVLDLLIPGGGMTLGRELIADHPWLRILILSATTDLNAVNEALRSGMAGYAIKTQPIEEILEAIHEVANGNKYLAPAFSSLPFERAAEHVPQTLSSLTPREREVFELTVNGLSSAEIGGRLFISRRTVETHRARILQKLRVRGAVGMVRLAAQWGLLPQEQERLLDPGGD